jgi:hypothetical protein
LRRHCLFRQARNHAPDSRQILPLNQRPHDAFLALVEARVVAAEHEGAHGGVDHRRVGHVEDVGALQRFLDIPEPRDKDRAGGTGDDQVRSGVANEPEQDVRLVLDHPLQEACGQRLLWCRCGGAHSLSS